ncbi:hypothetical protein [Kitasatospora sp. NPDC059327]|uniref:hypothetical protein n=1 Tax=Kitasatospora sp. NPDC059327 TaxID=3346803 RepID=UPI0036A4E8AC
MPEPTPAELPADLPATSSGGACPGAAPDRPGDDDEPEVVLHSADGDDGETPWCIGDMTAY